MNSDHLPIIISCTTSIRPQTSENRVFATFTDYTGADFDKLSPAHNIFSKAEKYFRRIVSDASEKCFLRIKKIIPKLPAEAADLIEQRGELRQNKPKNYKSKKLNKSIEATIHTHKRNNWR